MKRTPIKLGTRRHPFTTFKSFENAFAHCREMDRPACYRIGDENAYTISRLYPSGRAVELVDFRRTIIGGAS